MGLKKYFKKKSLLVLPACCLLLMSCGKRPVSSSASEDIEIAPALTKSVSLELSFQGQAELTSRNYMFQDKASVTIPEKVYIKSGQPLNYLVNIYFNTGHSPEQRDRTDQFYCSYRSYKVIGETDNPTPDGYDHRLVGCFDNEEAERNEEDLGYKAGSIIPLEEQMYIRVDLISGFSHNVTQLYTEFSIDWR